MRDSFVGNKGGERKRVECEIVYVAENLPDSRAGDLLRDVKQWQKREFLVDLSRDTIRGLVTTATAGVRRKARLVANGKNYRTQTNTKKEMVMTTLKKCRVIGTRTTDTGMRRNREMRGQSPGSVLPYYVIMHLYCTIASIFSRTGFFIIDFYIDAN